MLVLQGQIPGHGSGAENVRAGRGTLDHASVPVVLTGLRPSPTRHVVVGSSARALVGGI